MNNKMTMAGFTLIELLVVIAIIGILSAIAVPVYRNYSMKSFRSAAQSILLEEAQALEKYKTQNADYENAFLTGRAVSGGRYVVQFANANGDGSNADVATFTVQAIPAGGQVGDACGVLSIDNLGRRLPLECW